jgi:hypothetical protein
MLVSGLIQSMHTLGNAFEAVCNSDQTGRGFMKLSESLAELAI